MKKLMSLMLGMTLVFGTAALFGQEAPKKEETKKEGTKKKGGKKKSGEQKKEEKK